MQRGYPPAVGYPRVCLQEVRHWQKCRGTAHSPSLGFGTPSSTPLGSHLSSLEGARGDEEQGTRRRGWGCPGHSVSPMDEVDGGWVEGLGT